MDWPGVGPETPWQPVQREVQVHSHDNHLLRHTKHNVAPFTYQTVRSEHGTIAVFVCLCVCVNCARSVNTLSGTHSAAIPFQEVVHILTKVMSSVSQTKSKTTPLNPITQKAECCNRTFAETAYATCWVVFHFQVSTAPFSRCCPNLNKLKLSP